MSQRRHQASPNSGKNGPHRTFQSEASVVIVIPIYQANLSILEFFSLKHSLAVIKPSRQVCFIGPEGLDLSLYMVHFPKVPFVGLDKTHFESIQGYSRLLLTTSFYERFAAHEFMLVLQTDAILLKDDLDTWCSRPYDYVGAPWPDGIEIRVNVGVFEGEFGKTVRTRVGNGGLSLRRINKCIALLKEFPEAAQVFDRTGSNEDLFFGIMGPLSLDFHLPNEIVASTFSLELSPEYYFAVNKHHVPMGGHAWWKVSPAFWLKFLRPHADGILQHLSLEPG
jgi:hypothetical protein